MLPIEKASIKYMPVTLYFPSQEGSGQQASVFVIVSAHMQRHACSRIYRLLDIRPEFLVQTRVAR